MTVTRYAVLLLLTLTLAMAVPVARADAPKVQVELNKLEPREDDCRAYLILENRTKQAFTSLKFDLVMFDTDGVVAKRLAVETAPLAAGKTSLKVFIISSLKCDTLGRLLLNEVMACASASGPIDDCQALIATAARGKVPFIK